MPRTPQVIAQRTARLDGRVILNLLFAGLLLCASMLAAAAHAKAPPQSFADLTERLRPAVVNISTTQQVKQQRPQRGPQGPQVPPDRRSRISSKISSTAINRAAAIAVRGAPIPWARASSSIPPAWW